MRTIKSNKSTRLVISVIAATLNHEINNRLTSIISHAYVLGRGKDVYGYEDAEWNEFIKSICNKIQLEAKEVSKTLKFLDELIVQDEIPITEYIGNISMLNLVAVNR